MASGRKENEECFSVRMKHPTSLNVLLQLDTATLLAEMARLEDSIQRLVRSNLDILQFLQDEQDQSDPDSNLPLIEARDENLVTIETQKERIEMIKWCITRKTRRNGDDNPHYQLDYPHSAPQTSSPVHPIQPILNSNSTRREEQSSGFGNEGSGISL
ncbi:hypothetical protein VP01_945g4 [Puccinia sorghi]|uniref:Uncharacterized protein n=1 Tax=Puccinia sorghi TaxID=27349 RepID=A0A0L6U8N2_9BASI|nr:hypothetical protein VP01_945g4 [Puccinia sorghi]